MKREKKYYSKEFKIKAVELSNQRSNIVEVAQELNIPRKYIDRWKSEYNNDKTGVNAKSAEAAEIANLGKN